MVYVRDQRVIIELHSKLARLECRPKVQDQSMNEKFLLVRHRI